MDPDICIRMIPRRGGFPRTILESGKSIIDPLTGDMNQNFCAALKNFDDVAKRYPEASDVRDVRYRFVFFLAPVFAPSCFVVALMLSQSEKNT